MGKIPICLIRKKIFFTKILIFLLINKKISKLLERHILGGLHARTGITHGAFGLTSLVFDGVKIMTTTFLLTNLPIRMCFL